MNDYPFWKFTPNGFPAPLPEDVPGGVRAEGVSCSARCAAARSPVDSAAIEAHPRIGEIPNEPTQKAPGCSRRIIHVRTEWKSAAQSIG
jgi:hypothetical protein